MGSIDSDHSIGLSRSIHAHLDQAVENFPSRTPHGPHRSMASPYSPAHRRSVSTSSEEYFVLWEHTSSSHERGFSSGDHGSLSEVDSDATKSGEVSRRFAETSVSLFHIDRWYLFISCLNLQERGALSRTSIRMWRRAQIFIAVGRAATNGWNRELCNIMLSDRPRSTAWTLPGVNTPPSPRPPLPRFASISDVPNDFVGTFRMGSDWYHEQWHLLISCLMPRERRKLSCADILMWRKAQIYVAVEGAAAAKSANSSLSHSLSKSGDSTSSPLIRDELFDIMLSDRPRPAWRTLPGVFTPPSLLPPPPHFVNMSDVPEDFVGSFLVGRWYHEAEWYHEC